MSPLPSTRHSRFAPWTLWLVGLAVAFHPALLSGFGELQINLGDPRLVQYVLEHSWRWLAGHPGHEAFWSPPVFYPAANVGAYTDTLVGSAPVYWLLRALSLEAGPAYQLWMMACLSLDFLAAWLLLRRALGLGPWAAATGAFLFGFGVNRLANFNSPQLFPLYFGVLALYGGLRALEPDQSSGRRRAWLALLFAGLCLQAWSTFYPTFFLGLVLVVATLAGLLFRESRTRLLGLVRAHPIALALGFAACALGLWPLARAHLAAAEELGLRHWNEVALSLPNWGSWLFPGERNLVYGSLSDSQLFTFTTAPSQHSNGVGFLTLALALFGLWQGRRRASVRVASVTLLVLLLLSTRLGDLALWRLLYEGLPGARAIRYVARIGMYLPLVAGLGLALALEAAGRRSAWLALALGALCLGEQLHRLPARSEAEYTDAVRRVAARVDPECDAFVLTTRPRAGEHYPGVRPRLTQVFAMWVGLEARKPTLNGFYGNAPRGWRLESADPMGSEQEQALQKAVRAWIRRNQLGMRRIDQVSVPREWLGWMRDD